jgi:hypothetical protein
MNLGLLYHTIALERLAGPFILRRMDGRSFHSIRAPQVGLQKGVWYEVSDSRTNVMIDSRCTATRQLPRNYLARNLASASYHAENLHESREILRSAFSFSFSLIDSPITLPISSNMMCKECQKILSGQSNTLHHVATTIVGRPLFFYHIIPYHAQKRYHS